MLHDQLLSAAADDRPARVALLLAHGVPADGDEPGHPVHGGRPALELALLAGGTEAVDLLVAAGARAELDDAERALATLMRGEPATSAEAVARFPGATARAAALGKVPALRALAAAGFPLEVGNPLHEAAFHGHRDAVDALLALGADPTARDPRFHAPPSGWAEHNGHRDLAAHLRSIEG
ncbi:ankyrin repeat domain-containing protein [Actinokineospora bangkokensis]|uniref:Uncharacterized protein n=1 Tax=Actinokineospora bangkokensis TaxID=1193682 RepID=A0A1Q9LBN3_9PSEU|nr:ankyrin repeat domain-containing protein [Actinokineospora bangkokensis]OLR89439.1 hypothetical protein BJP25_04945 [Actinokineospora bangkokensis]